MTDVTCETDLYGPMLRALSEAGHRAFRNHVGVASHKDGSFVRHGLAPGSADLIGWTRDGRFLAIEVKRPGWKPTPKWRRSDQAKFLSAVAQAGGVSGIARSVEEALDVAAG